MKIIHLKNIDLNLLLVFDCIYREESLTLAGERLGRTQSAVSHALERLRSVFDDPLFVRTSKKMRPTSRAQELALPIQRALETIQEVLVPPERFSPEKLERTFSLSMSDYCEMVILPSLMESLWQRAPNVRIEVLSPATSDAQQGLETGTFDLIIGNKDVSSGIYQQKLFEDEFVCMVNENHSEIQDEITLENYLKYPHVLFSPRGKGDRLVAECLKKQNLKRKVSLQVPHILVIPRVLKNTPYIVTLPRKLANALDLTALQLLKPPIDLPKLPIMQYWHETMHHDPTHVWLRRMIQERIQKEFR
ncbi:MAG: LysR family transcriptional regulator [Proteobacteria bacterium]|nr:LysR family transcriptional regulator [Pseudomonadota bacterium]